MFRDIKTYRRLNMDMWRAQVHTPMSALTNKHCPKCNTYLYQPLFAIGGLPQMYVCKKCGYTGPIGLELVKLKKKKTKKSVKKRKSKKRRKS